MNALTDYRLYMSCRAIEQRGTARFIIFSPSARSRHRRRARTGDYDDFRHDKIFDLSRLP